MAADADIVLNTAADPARAASWLPGTVHVVDAGTGQVEMAWTRDGDARRYQISAHPEEHEVRWRPVEHDGWSAQLRVTDRGAGASEAELHLRAEGDPADDVRGLADSALAGLAAEVEQNFNVS
jgi:hypothetical protein